MIKIENLTKSFGDIKAVDGLSFEINSAGVVGLLGPNGAGKTTTMRLITKFLAPDSGRVTIQGNIGYLPENNPLYKEMLVSDIISMSAELKHIKKENKKRELDYVVASAGINDIYYRPISELSKGYKQRVGIAIALLNNPQILIMDEPTEGLDPNQRGEIKELIRNLAQDRIIVISTHILQEASTICDRLLIINEGKLVADGSPQTLTGSLRNQKTISVDIEGNNVEFLLKKINGIEKIEVEKTDNRRTKLNIISQTSFQPQPEISRIARENQWIIWSITEQKENLENIFQKLTNKKLNDTIIYENQY